ncbi:MAG: tocopherol cyclase family protein [bacterium]
MENDNNPRFLSAKPPFYEVYFLKLHLLEEGLAFWMRYTFHLNRKGEPHASLWAFALSAADPLNCRGALQSYPADEVHFHPDPLSVRIGGAELGDGKAKGRVQKKDFSLEWDLQFEMPSTRNAPALRPLRLFPSAWMYRGPFPKTKYLVPYPFALFSGRIIYQGKEYQVKNAQGEQAHLWGSQHAERWAWAHCNTFAEDPTAIFEGLSAQTKAGPILLPHFSLFYIRIQGKDYFFNRPALWRKNKSGYDVESWSFDLIDGSHRFIGHLQNDPALMLGVRYTDPREGLRYCCHAEWAELELEHYQKKAERWQHVITLHSRAATYEKVDGQIDPLVPVKVLG